MNTNVVYCESCLDTLRKMPDKFVDSVITSPPYWQLRDYGYPEQWGLEPTFQEYLEHLWSLMDLIWLKLKDTGTVWVNLGDSYARGARGKDGVDHRLNPKSKEHHIEPLTKPNYAGLDKCLLLLPHRFAIGCIERGWIVRNDIIWAKRNGMPEGVTDRFSKKHEYMFFMVKQQKYYFDLEAVREKTLTMDNSVRDRDNTRLNNTPGRERMNGLTTNNYTSKNPGSVSDFWDIPTKPNSVGHYAVYNLDLLKKPILAGSPEGGIIYDPFAGSGTTGIAALKAGRQFIGSEMSAEYAKIANEQIDEFQKQHSLF